MTRILIAASVVLIATPSLAADAIGTWQSEKADDGGYIHVSVAPCAHNAAKLCGTIIDAFNDDPAAMDETRAAELRGKVMIKDMEPSGATAWSNGTIWAPDDDETYASKMELDGDVLTVSGCVLAGLICRGQDWTRVP